LPLTDLDKAAARIRLAAERGEKVPYSATTMWTHHLTCLMTDFLRRHMAWSASPTFPTG
jgi:hypothetical protein